LSNAPAEARGEYEGYQKSIEAAIASSAERLASAEDALAELEAAVSQRRTWTFGADTESESAQFLHNALVEVVLGLEAMAASAKPDVAQRLSWAEQVREATFVHRAGKPTWSQARAAIAKADDVAASRLYAGRAIALPDDAVIGLVPIGMNPVTKLWEFYDLRSAWDGVQLAKDLPIPSHKEADGTIDVQAETGIVFVLLPGGTVTLGSQDEDPNAPFYDPQRENDERLRQVTLSPFFLARHEITRAQWQRLAGEQETGWEEGYGYNGDRLAIGRTHPADSMDWWAADRWMRRHGMTLPTEWQWEYGARGGTTTVYWSGQAASSLALCANVHDRTSFERYPDWGEPAPIEDGFRAISPAGHFRANAFGLHDVHGNVLEWCLDNYEDSASDRSYRGGCFGDSARYARSADRIGHAPSFRNLNLGLRPARLITE
jgi:formylglycine-generating enzyme required for sulfatase activity